MEQFRTLGLSEAMIKTLANKGFSEPTPIQQAVIPFILEGDRDVVAQAETGTGKTAAFAIPMIERMDSPDGHVKALVLVPTRELAIQVADETRSLRGRKKIEVVSIYGGQPFGPQRSALKHGADIVVGTTGRSSTTSRKGRCAWTASPTWSSTKPTRCRHGIHRRHPGHPRACSR